MAKELSMEDVYSIVGAKSNVSKHAMRRMWGNMVDLIISEMQVNGYIRLKDFGKFIIKDIPPHDEIITNSDGFKERVYVDAHCDIEFVPSVNLLASADGRQGKWSNITKYKDERDSLLIRQNGEVIKEVNPSCQGLSVDKSIEQKVAILLQRKINRNKKLEERKNNIALRKTQYALKCINNGITYDSIRSCAESLEINYNTLYYYYAHNGDEFKYKGYSFKKIKKESNDEIH